MRLTLNDRVGPSRRTGGLGRLPMRVDLVRFHNRRPAVADAQSPTAQHVRKWRTPPVTGWVDELVKHAKLANFAG